MDDGSLFDQYVSGRLESTTLAPPPGADPLARSTKRHSSAAPPAAPPRSTSDPPPKRKRRRRVRIPGPVGEWLKAKRMRESVERLDADAKKGGHSQQSSASAFQLRSPSVQDRENGGADGGEAAENDAEQHFLSGAWAAACEDHQQSAESVLARAHDRRYNKRDAHERVEGMRETFWHNLEWLRGMGYREGPVPGIIVMLDCVQRSAQGEATALLRDPSGTMLASFHSDAVYDKGAELHDGAVLQLKDFSVFTLASERSKKHEVNICLENIGQIWPKVNLNATTQSQSQKMNTPGSSSSRDVSFDGGSSVSSIGRRRARGHLPAAAAQPNSGGVAKRARRGIGEEVAPLPPQAASAAAAADPAGGGVPTTAPALAAAAAAPPLPAVAPPVASRVDEENEDEDEDLLAGVELWGLSDEDF